jgi:hypothetical protein
MDTAKLSRSYSCRDHGCGNGPERNRSTNLAVISAKSVSLAALDASAFTNARPLSIRVVLLPIECPPSVACFTTSGHFYTAVATNVTT